MKLVVQVPCLNEDEMVIVVIDDGCTDRTVEVARALGVTHFVHHARSQGLARSFQDGVNYALQVGADILVNTDGDNQYPQERIPDLVRPIIENRADIVIADRQVHLVEHFSTGKKLLQRVGSRVVNAAAGTDVPDAASGFRAYSRETLMKLNTVTRFSYCMESIIQAGNKRMRIDSVPVVTNAKTRESRLFTSTRQHVLKSMAAIVRAYIMYKPYVLFGWVSAVLSVLGLAPFVRYAVLVATGSGGGHLQSLLVGAVLLILAFLSVMLGVVSDLIRTNRILMEANLEHTKRARFQTRTSDAAEAPRMRVVGS
jgi:glycosyltransferase involved in cell wall biosynthesis